MRVLIVEDSASLRRSLERGLAAEGFRVEVAADGHEAVARAHDQEFDVVVLDLMLPGLSGLEVLRRVIDREPRPRVLILSACTAIENRVAGLDAGADDYLVKPFAFEELLARVRALVRRRHALATDRIEIDGVTLDLRAHTVEFAGRLIELPPRELALLELLMTHRGEVVSRAQIEARIYDPLVEPMSNVVDAAISVLRRRLREAGAPDLVVTRRGLGYVIP